MKACRQTQRGGVSILAILFVSILSMLALAFTTMSNINVQTAANHRDVAQAQAAAESGLDYACHLVKTYTPPSGAYTTRNTISDTESTETFGFFVNHVANTLGTGNSLWNGTELRIPGSSTISLNHDGHSGFAVRVNLEQATEDAPARLVITSTGTAGAANRGVCLRFPIQKDGKVLEYAIASRGRMWITGDSHIEGDVFSSWDRPEIAPFNMTDDSAVYGTVNTILGYNQMAYEGVHLETLDDQGNPIFDDEGNRVVSSGDELQGYHEGVNYDQPLIDVPGMNISDYDTDDYNVGLTTIPSCPSDYRVTEYFPHSATSYSQPSSSSSRRLTRHVYENQTFTDSYLPDNRNALFRNCTFEGTLYIDCYKSGSNNYNNVRFDDCTFNGPIITDVPQVLKWKENCLYFTGSATFQNTAMEEATILAPHFNVNLGNTNPVEGETNRLTGAIVGGIVDVRGNAEVEGTIISMCDTTAWSSGYVTNIGATLGDGGSETTQPGDVGTIHITPDPDKLLPSGIKTPIVIAMDGNSYSEL